MELLETAPEDARREEFADAVLRCGRAMFLCARSVLDTDADAEDTVSEAVLTAWSGYSRLREPESALWQAVCVLPADQRTAVTLFYYEDMRRSMQTRALL